MVNAFAGLLDGTTVSRLLQHAYIHTDRQTHAADHSKLKFHRTDTDTDFRDVSVV